MSTVPFGIESAPSFEEFVAKYHAEQRQKAAQAPVEPEPDPPPPSAAPRRDIPAAFPVSLRGRYEYVTDFLSQTAERFGALARLPHRPVVPAEDREQIFQGLQESARYVAHLEKSRWEITAGDVVRVLDADALAARIVDVATCLGRPVQFPGATMVPAPLPQEVA